MVEDAVDSAAEDNVAEGDASLEDNIVELEVEVELKLTVLEDEGPVTALQSPYPFWQDSGRQ
jgi:hypothetical protein